MSMWWVYIVPEDEVFYVGVTTDPPSRLREHGRSAACYLRGPMVQKEAMDLQLTYSSLTIHEQRELVFGITKRQ